MNRLDDQTGEGRFATCPICRRRGERMTIGSFYFGVCPEDKLVWSTFSKPLLASEDNPETFEKNVSTVVSYSKAWDVIARQVLDGEFTGADASLITTLVNGLSAYRQGDLPKAMMFRRAAVEHLVLTIL